MKNKLSLLVLLIAIANLKIGKQILGFLIKAQFLLGTGDGCMKRKCQKNCGTPPTTTFLFRQFFGHKI